MMMLPRLGAGRMVLLLLQVQGHSADISASLHLGLPLNKAACAKPQRDPCCFDLSVTHWSSKCGTA